MSNLLSNEDLAKEDGPQKLMVKSSYFEGLKNQITDKRYWDSRVFHVYNHEAGTGKSRFTLAEIADLVTKTDYKVLYVQRFKRGKAFEETLETINSSTKYAVADFIDGKDNKNLKSNRKKEKRKNKLNAKVLVITHKMYHQLCKGLHADILEGRQILIIDEFPDFMERVTVSLEDISTLWQNAYKFKNQEFIEDLVTNLKNVITKNMSDPRNSHRIPFLNFSPIEYEQYTQLLPKIINQSTLEETKILQRILQILTYGCRYSNGALHRYNNEIEPKLLENNIILDANAGFDYRYKLSNLFHVHQQPKFYNYSNSTLTHYSVNTSKNGLSRNINFYQKAFEKLSLSFNEKTLFVTDLGNKEKLQKELHKYLESNGKREILIGEFEGSIFAFEHFGNIIGVNNYRDFENVLVMKTPNFDYLDYVLQYDFYKPAKHLNEDITIFEDPIVEQIRITMIAGEIYQALKRINRNNSKNARYFVFTTNHDAIELVHQQFPKIKFFRHDLDVDYMAENAMEKPKTEKQIEKENRLQLIMEYLLTCKEEGKEKVSKLELRKLIGCKDGSNFGSQYLKPLEGFLNSQNMYNEKFHITIEKEITREEIAI